MTSPADHPPGEAVKMTVSQRDVETLAVALRSWLAGQLGVSDPPVISNVRMPVSGGMSSTSVLFEADRPHGYANRGRKAL